MLDIYCMLLVWIPRAVFRGRRRMPTIHQRWSMGLEKSCFGVLFCKGDRTISPYWGVDGCGHVSRDFEQRLLSLTKSIEDGSWLVIPSWQWPETHNQGNDGGSISISWSCQTSLQTWNQLEEVIGGSWNSMLPSDNQETWKIWRRPLWRGGPRSLLLCVQTWSRTTGNIYKTTSFAQNYKMC